MEADLREEIVEKLGAAFGGARDVTQLRGNHSTSYSSRSTCRRTGRPLEPARSPSGEAGRAVDPTST